MPQAAWSAKRERQYEHIKEGLEEHGRDEDVAEEIAARTVNKERARAGEAGPRAAPPPTTSPRVDAAGSARTADPGDAPDQLYEEARRKNVKGRSKMSKAQLERAVDR